jgi:hypothetical protein
VLVVVNAHYCETHYSDPVHVRNYLVAGYNVATAVRSVDVATGAVANALEHTEPVSCCCLGKDNTVVCYASTPTTSKSQIRLFPQKGKIPQ